MRKRNKVFKSFALVLVLMLTACGTDANASDDDMGEVVSAIEVIQPLEGESMVGFEITKQVVEELVNLGVDAEATPTEKSVIIEKVYGEDKEFDAFYLDWSGRPERLDPDMFLHSIFHSENIGGNNMTKFSNEAFDAVADKQRQETDVDKRKEYVYEAQEILADEVPMLVTHNVLTVQAYNKDKFSDVVQVTGEGLFNEWTPVMAKPKTDDKTMVVAATDGLNTLNPYQANTVYEWRNLRMVYDKLARLSLDVEAVPSAAEKWEQVDDTTIDVTMRDGAKFHDGKPVTVEDVKFSYDTFKEKAAYFSSFLSVVDSVEVVDDNTVRFNLTNPTASFIGTTFTQIPIVPKHVWENVDIVNYENAEMVGSGPFKLKNYRPGEEFVTETNKDYYEPANIDGYVFKIYGNDEGVMTELESNIVDVMNDGFTPSHAETVEANEGGKYDHLEVTKTDNIGFEFIGFNMEKSPFNNKAFRTAMAYLVDYDMIVDVLLNGNGVAAGGGMSLVKANEFWHNENAGFHNTYNPEKARSVLEEAGFTWDSKGKLRMPK